MKYTVIFNLNASIITSELFDKHKSYCFCNRCKQELSMRFIRSDRNLFSLSPLYSGISRFINPKIGIIILSNNFHNIYSRLCNTCRHLLDIHVRVIYYHITTCAQYNYEIFYTVRVYSVKTVYK